MSHSSDLRTSFTPAVDGSPSAHTIPCSARRCSPLSTALASRCCSASDPRTDATCCAADTGFGSTSPSAQTGFVTGFVGLARPVAPEGKRRCSRHRCQLTERYEFPPDGNGTRPVVPSASGDEPTPHHKFAESGVDGMERSQAQTGTVLVTGGSGFLGGWCLVELVRRGYQARTTVRDLSREPEIRAMLASEVAVGDR